MALTKISRSLLDTGVSDSSDATAITIDSSERVLIGTTDAGYPDYGDSLTLGDVDGGGGNAGMTIRSGTSSYGTFYFSDATGTAAGTYAGKMQYNHSNNSMVFGTNSTDKLTIDSSGRVGLGTTSPAVELHINDATGLSRIRLTGGASGADNFEFGQGTTGVTNGGFEIYDVDQAATRFVIDLNGKVMMGRTAQINSSLLSVDDGGVGITYAGAPSTYYRQMYQSSGGNFFFYNGNNQGYIDQSGAFNDASDERIKKDIEDINYGLDIVKALKPRKYKMKLNDSEQIGFIAQEVESLIPEVVDTGETPDGEEQKGMSYGHLTAVLTKAIQELSAKVEELESKINE